MVRSINKRGTKYAVFGLIGEQVDFELLGLHYATEARVLIEKLSADERAVREPAFICTTAADLSSLSATSLPYEEETSSAKERVE